MVLSVRLAATQAAPARFASWLMAAALLLLTACTKPVSSTLQNDKLSSAATAQHTRKLGVPLSLSHRLPLTMEVNTAFNIALELQGSIPEQALRLTFRVDGDLAFAGPIQQPGQASTGPTVTELVEQPAQEFNLLQDLPQQLVVPLVLGSVDGGYLYVQLRSVADGIISQANHVIAVRKQQAVKGRREANLRSKAGVAHDNDNSDEQGSARVALPADEVILPAP